MVISFLNIAKYVDQEKQLFKKIKLLKIIIYELSKIFF